MAAYGNGLTDEIMAIWLADESPLAILATIVASHEQAYVKRVSWQAKTFLVGHEKEVLQDASLRTSPNVDDANANADVAAVTNEKTKIVLYEGWHSHVEGVSQATTPRKQDGKNILRKTIKKLTYKTSRFHQKNIYICFKSP